MWLVARGGNGMEPGRRALPAPITETLRIWYTGQGTRPDEVIAVRLVQEARKRGQWLACDCRGESAPPPLMSPALLTEADTYYLRRLTGAGRPEHHVNCPYFRDQALGETLKRGESPRNPPDGLFAVLKPRPVNLAGEPETERPATRTKTLGYPRLAKLLWRLLSLGQHNIIPPIGDEGERSIAEEFATVRRVASATEIAPGIKLNELLFTHPRDWQSRRIFAILRKRAIGWPDKHEPQAFLLLFGKNVHGSELETSEGPIDLGHKIEHAGTAQARVPGPALVIAAIGKHPDDGGLRALRAWSQPIFSGHRFIPVEDEGERQLAQAILEARRLLAPQGVLLSAHKPLFDLTTPAGEIRPHWLVQVQRRGRPPVQGVIEVEGRRQMTDQAFAALSFFGPVLTLGHGALEILPSQIAELAGQELARQ